MKDRLLDKITEAVGLIDQSVAFHRDAGEEDKAEADAELAEAFAGFADKLRPMLKRIEQRIERNRERRKQGLPPLTIEEHLALEKDDAHGLDL